MIVVTGATGNVGGRIAEQLLGEGRKVRAVARNRDKLKGLADRGAEVAAGDLEDPSFLARVFAGAEAAFVLIPPNLAAADFPAWQDRVGESIVKALREARAKRVVHLSSRGAELPSGTGPVAGLHRQEQRLNGLPGVDVLHLRPGYFMENFLGSAGMAKKMGILGSATRPDVPISMIATQDIARHAASRLAKLDFRGQSVQDLLGPRDVTMREAAAALGRAVGKPDLAYVQFPPEDAVKGMVGMGLSESVARGYVEMSAAFNEGRIAPAKRDAVSTTPTTLEEFAPAFASAYKAA